MNLGWRITSTVAPMVASAAVTKLIDTVWDKVTGHKPPVDPDEPDVDLREVLVFALVSGALIGLARQLALRQASRWYGTPTRKASVAED